MLFRSISPRGKKINLIEMQPKILPEPIFHMNESMLTEMIDNDKNITVHTGTKLLAINEDSIEIEKDGKKSILPCDTVVLAMGLRSENTLVEELKEKMPVYVIGDCKAPRHIAEAVLEARNTILSL